MKNKNFILATITLILVTCLSWGAPASATPHLLHGSNQRVCDDKTGRIINCLAKVVTNKSNKPAVTPGPAGYGPVQFHTAYQLPTTSASPATIAVVDAYDDPNITTDLATYDSTFGLPVFPTCTNTVKTSCFQKVNQNGGTFYPSKSGSWSLETSLDVETAHQICQNCKLILVEANSSSYNSLMTAVDRARIMGATVISNSYGSGEFSSETFYDSHFNYPGIAFLFAAGDQGYGAMYPAASRFVTGVGGTTLIVDSLTNNWQTETAWNSTGSGCSLFETKPTFQSDTGCLKRTVADVSADADPNTGAAVYDSVSYYGYRGWFQVGGTSLATPIIAGIYGLTNNVSSGVFANTLPYANANYSTNLHDITSGSNGNCGTYLCQAGTGFDGPTGLGSPEGLTAF